MADRRFAVLGCLALAACRAASLDDSGDRDDGGVMLDAAASASSTLGACLDGLERTTRIPARRLTAAEYDASVRDLFGVTSRPGARFLPVASSSHGSTTTADLPTAPHVLQYLLAAEDVAREARPHLEALVAERCADLDADACVALLLDVLGRRVWRRPLSPDERSRLLSVAASVSDADAVARFEPVLAVMLQAPQFLYRIELGSGVQVAPDVVRLSGHEVATRLSFFLWGSTPDDALLDAADRGVLNEVTEVVAHAERMLDDPRARDAVAELHRAWLGYDQVLGVAKDPDRHPGFSRAHAETLADDTRRFVEEVVLATRDATLADLLAGETGILTQPSLLAALAHPSQSSPIRRGYLVRERVLCQALPPPPPDVRFEVPEPSESSADDTTTRERFSVVRASPLCANCHDRIDPIGLAFEHYDAAGAWREEEAGRPVDARARLVGTDVDGEYDGAASLADALAESGLVRACYASRWVDRALGWGAGEGDACTADAVLEAFALAGHRIRDLVLAIVRTEAFRHVAVGEEGGACP